MQYNKINDIAELKKIQLDILKYVSNFCEANGIKCWLTGGTLLGAVRHKGYIPWDDDIDLGMTRKNYDRFIEIFNNSNERYSFHCIENDKKYCYQMGKVFDNNTILYEPDKKHGYKISVYIDIFVHDYLPENQRIIKKLYDRRDFFKHIRTLQKSTEHRGSQFRKICVQGMGKILSLIPPRHLARIIANNGKKYRYINSSYYGSLVGDCRIVIEKRLLDLTEKMMFEGAYYNVPAGYNEYLISLYGDYMKLPPVEERISPHMFEAYYITNKQ